MGRPDIEESENVTELKKMWELYPEYWSTEAKFWGWIRSGIRMGLWKKHPVKIGLLLDNRVKEKKKFKNGRERDVWKVRCNHCRHMFSQNEVNIDHIHGNNSLSKDGDVMEFLSNIVFVERDELQILCKECHDIKTYTEKYNVSTEQAIAEKEAIAIQKAKRDKEWLTARGLVPGSNANKRREQIVMEVLKNGK